MASQAARRLLPFLANNASSASSLTGLGKTFERAGAAGFSSLTGDLQGSLIPGFDASHRDQQESGAASQATWAHLPSMYHPSFACSIPALKQATCMPSLPGRRGISSLAGHRLPLGLQSQGSGSKVSAFLPSTTARRGYITDGQLLGHMYLLATDIMFWSGLIGAVVFRRNLIVMLLATEIVMLACNLNFLFAAAYLNDMTGVIMSITITTIAACETAIGLALCVTYFHLRSATDVEALNLLK